MSPTVLRTRGYRFYFFSREEPRMHIHVSGADGEAKFWLAPNLELAYNHNLKPRDLRAIEAIISEHFEEFVDAWRHHFGS